MLGKVAERVGIDPLTEWLGLRWDEFDRVRLTVRDELLNPAGLLAGPVLFAMVDYSMGSALWRERNRGERIATIGISLNYVQTARGGDVLCTSRVDRRNDRVAVLRSEVTHEDGRLLATAVGSFSIFPAERLGVHERRAPAPGVDERAPQDASEESR
jgi:acyl-CoA thioesterase